MKMRVKFGENKPHFGNLQKTYQEKIDEILFWCMESNIDAEFYTFYTEERCLVGATGNKYWEVTTWGIFTIDPEYMFLFILRWGAVLHKKQREVV